MDQWGSDPEHQTRRRILISMAAYAYEILDEPYLSDHMYDDWAERIHPEIGTGNMELDIFFYDHYSPMTGMWIHKHPDLEGIKRLYDRYYSTVLSKLRSQV